MKFIISTISIIFISFSSLAEINTGITNLQITDTNRLSWDGKNSRPIITSIFYPTDEKNIEKIMIGAPDEPLFYAGHALWEANIKHGDKKPLIIMSHGTGGAALQMLWIAEKLVKKGYIVAAVNHHGNTAAEEKQHAPGYILWWERALDFKIVINELKNNPNWSKHIDTNHIGALGFSLGGYSVLSAIGAITDKELFYDFCNSNKRDSTCDDQIEFPDVVDEFEKVANSAPVIEALNREQNSFLLPEIKATVAIAPAVVQTFKVDSLKAIKTPTLIIGGGKDSVAPIRTNAGYASAQIPNNRYEIIEQAGHYTFLANCTKLGKKYLTNLCMDAKNTNREEIHDQVNELIVDFFDQKLK